MAGVAKDIKTSGEFVIPQHEKQAKGGSSHRSGTWTKIMHPKPPTMDFLTPSGAADYLEGLRLRLTQTLVVTHQEAEQTAEVARTSPFVEMPFLIWQLFYENRRNIFTFYEVAADLMVDLSNQDDKDRERYMASHKNTVDAKRFPVHAELVARGRLVFSTRVNKFVWPP